MLPPLLPSACREPAVCSADPWQGGTFGVVETCGGHSPAPCRPRTPQPGEVWRGAGAWQGCGGAVWPWASPARVFLQICFLHWALLRFFLSLLGAFHQLPEKQSFSLQQWVVNQGEGSAPYCLLSPRASPRNTALLSKEPALLRSPLPHKGLALGVLSEGGHGLPAVTRWRTCSLLPARPCVPPLLVHTPLYFKTKVKMSWSRVQNLHHFPPITTKYFSAYVLRTQTYFYISTVQLLISVSWTLRAVYFLHVSLVVPVLSLHLFLPVWF